jgi:hypothetical protein
LDLLSSKIIEGSTQETTLIPPEVSKLEVKEHPKCRRYSEGQECPFISDTIDILEGMNAVSSVPPSTVLEERKTVSFTANLSNSGLQSGRYLSATRVLS